MLSEHVMALHAGKTRYLTLVFLYFSVQPCYSCLFVGVFGYL